MTAVDAISPSQSSMRNLGEVPMRDLKGQADAVSKQVGIGAVAPVSTAEGNASVVAGISADLTTRSDAVELEHATSGAN